METVLSFTLTTMPTMPLLVTILSPERMAFIIVSCWRAFLCWGRMKTK